jgi:hypothetical protein
MSPYQQDVIQSTLQEYDVQAQRGLGGFLSTTSITEEHLVKEQASGSKKLNINLHQIEIELHYKHNYYNKVLVKHNNYLNNNFSIKCTISSS